MTTRKLTIKEDEEGLYVRYKDWDDHLVLRIGNITDTDKVCLFSKGDKVNVRRWNINMGYFLVSKPGGHNATCMWQGPRWDGELRAWVKP